jgi:malonate transporter and related proteins
MKRFGSAAWNFGVLFGLRYNVSSEVVGTTLVASTVLSVATLAAAIYLTADMGQP